MIILETIVESLEQAKELPAVKRLYNNPFVKSKVNQFERFIGRIVKRNLEKATKPSKRKLTILNVLLINAVVLAYYAGLADAKNMSELQILFENYKIIGIALLVVNISLFLLIEIGKILKTVAIILLQIFAFLFAAFLVYWMIIEAYKWFKKVTTS